MNTKSDTPHNSEPLAIIGFAAKYSQEASDVDKFWEFLLAARESMTGFPKDRLNLNGYYHPDAEYTGTIHAKGAHFLAEDPNTFDAAFFNVNKTEVMSLDPQQRLVMENVYHALENAGIPMDQVISSNSSVFVSGFNHDHRDRLNLDPEICLKHRPTGSEASMISGRVSWFYDFKGPSLTVDTACSSSMVAFHLANQSILLGDSDMAIVSGVNVFASLNHILGMSYSGFLSSEGRCFTFDHRADGYSRGEGVGTVIIKPLSKALADGNTVRAVIRATALNHDGRTPGLTYPSGDAQERLIRTVYDLAGLNPEDTLYVESHGTGTPAGDPIEVKSIARGFRSPSRKQPIYIGAVKPNIGHIEGGSGISGIIKAILILESGIIPPNVNMEKVNPQIHSDEWNVKFPTQAMPWPVSGARRVSVNCFGLSGTNGHCILEDAYHFMAERGLHGLHNARPVPPTAEEIKSLVQRIEHPVERREIPLTNGTSGDILAPKLVLLSGFDADAPKRLCGALLPYLQQKLELSDASATRCLLADVAYTLSERRSRFRWNSFLLANSVADLVAQLASEKGIPPPVSHQKPPRIGFVFTGQGAQYPGMGAQLLQFSPFRKSLEEATEYMKSLGCEWSLIDEILKDMPDSNIHQAAISHPSCTAIQVALVDLLQSWNICPARVIGHSSGEIAAAYCAGKISREAAWNVAYHRGRLTSHIPRRTKGAMLAVGLDSETIQPFIGQVHKRMPGELIIACFNSPKNNTVSGDEPLILALQDILEEKGIFVRRLRTPNAYHSPHMNDIAEDYLQAMGKPPDGYRVAFREPVRMFSTSTGDEVLKNSLPNEFWVNNLVSTVKFTSTLQSMCFDQGSLVLDELLEIGSHCALQSAVKETLGEFGSVSYRATLSRNDATTETTLNTAGGLLVRGARVNLQEVNRGKDPETKPQFLIDFPQYPFDHREKGLYESRVTRFLRFRDTPRHFLLGAMTPDSNSLRWSWRHFLRVNENPWLKDHAIAQNIVFPGAGYITMAVEAVRQIWHGTTIVGIQIRDVAFKSMLVIPDNKEGIETCFALSPAEESSLSTSARWSKFSVSSYDTNSDEWTENCTGYISIDTQSDPNPVTEGRENNASLKDWKNAQEQWAQCLRPMDFSRVCDNLESVGIRFGPLFRNISNVKIGGHGRGLMAGTISIPDVAACMPKNYTHPHLMHPATLDATLQAGIAAICDYLGSGVLKRGNVPAFIKNIWISPEFPAQGTLNCQGSVHLLSHDTYNFDVRVWDAESNAGLISLSGIRLTPFQSASDSGEEKQRCHSIEWAADANFLCNSMLQVPSSALDTYEREKVWFSELQLVGALLATDALRELQGQALTPTTPEHLHRFYDLLKQIVADVVTGGIPYLTFDDWQKYTLNPALKSELYDRVAERDANGAVLLRMGSQIASFLQQKADPLYPMFGQDDLMARYYDMYLEMGPIPSRFAAMMSHMRYTFSNLKILEVGSGTGGFTLRVLELLCPMANGSSTGQSIARYDFTDVSPSFFEKAKARLANWEHFMNFKRLDIGEDPLEQGFEAGSYDMVLASNVLHASSDLRRTLRRMRSLLKPSGKLLFLEGVRQDNIDVNMSFSALPGWWLGEEPIRKWCPYIPTEMWQEYLCETGFSGLDVTIPSSQYPEFNRISVMLSTAIESSDCGQLLRVVIISSGSDKRGDLDSTLLNDIKHQKDIMDCSLVRLHEIADTDLQNVICISLMELYSPVLGDADEATFSQIRHFLTTCHRIIWVTGVDDPRYNMATGLIRTLRWERDSKDLNLVTLAMDPDAITPEEASKVLTTIFCHQFINSMRQPEHWNAEYRFHDGQIETNRLTEDVTATNAIHSRLSHPDPSPLAWEQIERPVRIDIGKQGALDSLQWITDADIARPLGATEVEVEVHAVGLNFRDLLTVMGELPQGTIGGEAAGAIVRIGSAVNRFKIGDRVAYFGDPNHVGTFRSLGRADQDLVVGVPDDFSLEQAASMPVIYTTVIYSLKHVAKLAKGESVLIHAAAGGVGQAAIQYAQLVGAEVFATVSTVEKKQHLIQEYGIPEDHIFSSRDLSFATGIRDLAPGGVDVILNSLAGEALRQSWDCIAPFGRFVEIGKRDLLTGGRLDMSPFLKNAVFASVDLLTVAKHRPAIVRELLEDMVRLWRERKIEAPKPVTILPYSKIQTGFRSLQMGQNMGKIVCVPTAEPILVLPDPEPPFQLESNASYILAGGLGGIGRSIAHWMASRGARHLIFLSRSHKLTTAAEATITTLESMGCQSHIFCCDISNARRLAGVLKEIQSNLPPIKGCINCSVAWADGAFDNMTHAGWQTPLGPKVQGSWNLHQALQFPELQFFIMLSSVAGVVGNRSQANYNAGNAFQDALARYRVTRGFPGTSVDLGAVVSVGFMAENREYVKHSLKIATHHREDQMLAILEYVLNPRHVLPEPRSQLVCGLSTQTAYEERGIPPPRHLQYPMFLHLQDSRAQTAVQGDKTDQYHVQAFLAAASSREEAVSVVLHGIQKKLSSILSVDEADIDAGRSIQENGVDSLIEMEFRTWVSKELGASLSKADISSKSLEDLSGKIVSASAFSHFRS